MSFEILGSPTVPLVAHVPHGGLSIPPEIRSSLLLDDLELDQELLRVTDRHTAALFSGVVDAGGVMFVNHLSRLVFDPERFRSDDDEIMAKRGVGAVYRKTTDGRDLRAPTFSDDDRERVLAAFYDPYTRALADLCREILDRFGRCLIVDCHSYPSVPMDWELDHDPRHRPPVSFGTDDFHTPPDLVARLEAVAAGAGLASQRDRPFKGTYVPTFAWQRDRRVSSVMIELRRDIYMDETTGQPAETFEAIQSLVRDLIDAASG